MPTDIRVQRHSTSLINLRNLLLEIVRKPGAFAKHPQFSIMLKSQKTLASFSDAALGISHCSLNTLKRTSARIAPAAYKELEDLRKRALVALGQCTKSTGRATQESDSASRAKEDLKASLQKAREDMLLVTFIMEKAMKHARRYAEKAGDTTLTAICEKEQKELHAMLACRKIPTAAELFELL